VGGRKGWDGTRYLVKALWVGGHQPSEWRSTGDGILVKEGGGPRVPSGLGVYMRRGGVSIWHGGTHITPVELCPLHLVFRLWD